MRSRKATILMLAAGSVLLCTGCPFMDTRVTNQGGGTVISAVNKIGSQHLASLTPDEVQILTDTFSNLQDKVDVFVTDAQAADAVFFLIEHDLNSFEDVQRFIAEAQADPDSIEVPESLILLAESIDLSRVP